MVLKTATKDDLKALQQTCIAAYSKNFHHHWEPGGLDWFIEKEFGDARIKKDLADKDIRYYFIMKDQLPVGFVKIRNAGVDEYQLSNVLELEKIYILPEIKSYGIGKKALLEIIASARTVGKEYILLTVIDTNVPAIAFYEKHGFAFHSKTRLEIPYFKEELKGANKMILNL